MTVLPPPDGGSTPIEPNDPMSPIDPTMPEHPTDPRKPLEPTVSGDGDGVDEVDLEAVAGHYREMTGLGADIKGEGQIVPD
jgi:hypothetical protein